MELFGYGASLGSLLSLKTTGHLGVVGSFPPKEFDSGEEQLLVQVQRMVDFTSAHLDLFPPTDPWENQSL